MDLHFNTTNGEHALSRAGVYDEIFQPNVRRDRRGFERAVGIEQSLVGTRDFTFIPMTALLDILLQEKM